MIMIYYWDNRNGGHLEHVNKRILWARDIKSMGFFKFLSYQRWGHAIFLSFFFFFFWVSCPSSKSLIYLWVTSILRHFSLILSLNKLWRKIFCPLLMKELWSRIKSYFKLFSNQKQKEHNIIIRVICSHIGPMYIETLNTMKPSYVLNSILISFLRGWLGHYITQKGW